MKLTKITLENFRRFEKLELVLEGSAHILLIGNNGAGKSSILEAVTKGLSWLVARINREKGNGSTLDDGQIRNGQNEAVIMLEVKDQEHTFHWSLAKTRKGRKKTRESQLANMTALAEHFRTALTNNAQNASLPLIAYYPVERVVLDVPIRTRSLHTFAQVDGYDNALQQGVDFRRFFEWFREREDTENESSTNLNDQILNLLANLRGGDPALLWQELDRLRSSPKDRQLTAVRSAIAAFMPGFDNLRIQRRPRLLMMIDKDGLSFDVGQLSQGEKSLIALVGDIARRLAMMNPAMINPLEGEGIVMIDEVDLHLHPKWQRTILGNLARTFPNVQFILTTHSPIIISQEKNARSFMLAENKISSIGDIYGMDVNQVLLQEMDTDIRNPVVQEKIDQLLETIQDGNMAQAKDLLTEMERELPADHLELSKARLLLRRLELRRQGSKGESS
ncbi:AAA family ATPase [Candidatus Magnetaquicoccus inordinatus]|uniref:AAA family ATPase n=1 Tax=Candidatus Magnetaquicoccus inordinatus TaxID=2496818 RepID=UPI00102C60D7|nr:AAA family ATPase [Candidatus Magnetaquicoccus inordinatus]